MKTISSCTRRTLVAAALAAVACGDDSPNPPPPPFEGVTTHGISIPTARPRLWYAGSARLAGARTWYASNPFTPSSASEDVQALERATRGLLDAGDPADQQTQCRAALDWALATTASMAAMPSGTDRRDGARWHGESIVVAYDWCYPYLTAGEKAAFIADTNAWIEGLSLEAYGNVPMYMNNYYWGFIRNQTEWAIASYEDNVAAAEALLDDALVARIENDFDVRVLTEGKGGVFVEGSQYGPYVANYSTIPFTTALLMGRDLRGESPFWVEAVYAFIYATTPGTTGGAWYFFPHSDSGYGLAESEVASESGNFMTAQAMQWAGTNVGQHARQWLTTTSSPRSRHVLSVDTGSPARAFGDLPLDYWAPGVRYLYGRSAWTSAATAFFLQLGDRDTAHIGHAHDDWGTWQLWRGGEFVSRETAVYSHTIQGYANGGAIGGARAVGHNSLLVGGAASASSPLHMNGVATVPRLQSHASFAFAAVDLTPTATSTEFGNPAFVSWVRDFVFVRPLETLVVLDRLESSTAGATKTFLAHCSTNPALGTGTATCTVGTQALVMTTLVPAASTYRTVNEASAGNAGPLSQYRIEVDTSPGTAQSYILTVLQAKSSGAASLSPSVAENSTSFTLTLSAGNTIAFQKGMSSSGGSITTGGTTTPFRADAQAMTVTEAGPAWQ